MTSGFASRITSKAASKWPVLAGGRARGAPQFTTSPGNGTALPGSFGRNSVHSIRRMMRSFKQFWPGMGDWLWGGGSGEL